MPTSRVRSLNLASYANGAAIPETNVPDWVSEIIIEFALPTTGGSVVWTPLQTLTIRLDLSLDGGATWKPDYWAGSVSGGIQVHPKTGLEIPLVTIGNNFPAGTQNKVRGQLDIVNGPITTEAFITLNG